MRRIAIVYKILLSIILLAKPTEVVGYSFSAPYFTTIDSLANTSDQWILRENKTLQQIVMDATDAEYMRLMLRNIRKFSKNVTKTTKVAEKESKFRRNRNKQRLPFDENRACRNIPDFYLSASDVITPEQCYIVSQAPMQHTLREFWIAILHTGCPLIASLTMSSENGKDKCYPFWDKNFSDVIVDDWSVTLEGEEVIEVSAYSNQRIVKRTFKASRLYKPEERFIYQLHYENWNDGWIPEQTLFSRYLDEMDYLNPDAQTPILVHCSAGVGRSGMVVAAHSIRKAIYSKIDKGMSLNSIKINIPKVICALRLQRCHMVGTSDQLKSVYRVLGRVLKNNTRDLGESFG